MYMIIIPFIIMVITIITSTVIKIRKARRASKPIKVADIKVKVASSGFGVVYHKLDCKKCKNGHEMPLMLAIANGYQPCATCGGH